MKVKINKDELYDLSIQLKKVMEEIDEIQHIYTSQIEKDDLFSGLMADAYQYQMQELYHEHQKIIKFYQALIKDMQEFTKDFEDIESSLNTRVDVL